MQFQHQIDVDVFYLRISSMSELHGINTVCVDFEQKMFSKNVIETEGNYSSEVTSIRTRLCTLSILFWFTFSYKIFDIAM